ncbi:MAG: hypothetical protein AB1765_11760, partial [Candidatus Hydrogenedentota bacterium]
MIEEKKFLSSIFAGFFFFYLIFCQGVRTGDCLLTYTVCKNLITRGTTTTDWGIPEMTFKGIDGRNYSKFGIGMSLIAIPFYYAGDFFSRFCKGETAKEVMRHWFCSLLSIFSAALTVVVAYLI